MFLLILDCRFLQEFAGFLMITANQEKLIIKLLEGKTLVDAATELGVSERTVYGWNKKPDFQRAYQEERQRQLNSSITSLQLKFDNAVETLNKHTNAVETTPRDQIKAAEVIVGKTLQTADLTRRIAELESMLAERDQEQQFILKFDVRKMTREHVGTLRRIHAEYTD